MSDLQSDLQTPVTEVSRIPLEAFAGQAQRGLQPLVDRIDYYSTVPLDAEQVKQSLHDPAAVMPRSLLERIPPIRLVLVPYLEKGPAGSTDSVMFERPATAKVLARSFSRWKKRSSCSSRRRVKKWPTITIGFAMESLSLLSRV